MSMLQELLNLGLVEIGSEDSRFEKMQAASTALVKLFGKEPSLLIPATLIALDEDVDEDDPFLVLVEEIVAEEWKTLRNTHTNRPRQLLRSIAIDALDTASAESAEISGIIWNTAVSPVRHQQVRLGKTSDLIGQLLGQACDRAEAEAVKRAGMSVPAAKRRKKKASGEPTKLNTAAKIKTADVLQDVVGAAGPHDANSQAPPTPNPHWSAAAPQWSYEFAPRMTAALVKAVNLGTSRLTESIGNDLAEYMASLETQLLEQQKESEQLQIEMAQSNASGRIRLDILWWSEACYSPLLKKGYRELDKAVAALIAAADLAAIVPPLAPSSVSYVLAETVADLSRGAETSELTQSLECYLKTLSEASLDLGGELSSPMINEKRMPLVDLVTGAAAGTVKSTESIRGLTGVDPELQIGPADFAMWMFRDLQARRMVEALS